jgi:hypothetical protein
MNNNKAKQKNSLKTIEVSDIDYQANEEEVSANKNIFKRFIEKYRQNKKIAVPITILAILALLLAIPFTRYKILGLFIKKTAIFSVIDSQTSRPVSGANVVLGGVQKNTDLNGKVEFNSVNVGPQEVRVENAYYQEYSTNVKIALTDKNNFELKIKASGRLVPVTIINSVSGKPLDGVKVTVKDSSALSDEKGMAVIALDPNEETVNANLELSGYNLGVVSIKVSDEQLPENNFKLVPEGRISFLSKSSGKIDVVSTNLDGTDRKTVLEGTGQEDENSTTLFASRDWKYLVLYTRREGPLPSLYLIDITNNSSTKIDESGDSIFPVGWSDKYFVYQTSSSQLQYWQPKYNLLKSYDTSEKINRTLDFSNAEGNSEIDFVTERISDVSILSNEVVYNKIWTADYYSGGRIIGKSHSFNSIKPGGTDRQLIKEFEAEIGGNSTVTSKKYNPQTVYVKQTSFTQNRFFEYINSKITERPQLSQSFDNVFPNYIASPTGSKTLWYESRDGKNVIFVGDKNSENSRKVIDKSEYNPVGWYSDEYILLSTKGSELFAASVYGAAKPVKVSDFQPNSGQTYDGSFSYIVR